MKAAKEHVKNAVYTRSLIRSVSIAISKDIVQISVGRKERVTIKLEQVGQTTWINSDGD